MNDYNDFRDRLMSSQQLTPEYRERYERSLESMFERVLTPAQKAGMWFKVALSLVGTAAFAWGFTIKGMPSLLKALMAFLAVVALAQTVIVARAAVMGIVNLRWQPKVGAYMSFQAILITSFVVMIYGVMHPNPGSTYLLLAFVVPVIIMSVVLIRTHIEQSELNVREKLLEIELRLAELSEQLPRK